VQHPIRVLGRKGDGLPVLSSVVARLTVADGRQVKPVYATTAPAGGKLSVQPVVVGVERNCAMKIVVAVLVACLWLMPDAGSGAPAHAEAGSGPNIELPQADRDAIQGVIRQQIQAFRRDDPAAAFAFAAPPIQQMFGDAERFMDMVREAYAPVYRPREVTFGELVTIDGELVQKVELVGPEGEAVLALYTMQRQPDGSWRINGCTLTRSPARTA
jgi:hypothetical protein